MKKQLLQKLLSGKSILSRTLMVLTLLVMSVSGTWADDVTVPTPYYFNGFSSTDGLTIVGDGEFTTDNDARFGQIYHNNPDLTKAGIRTNYLLLPSTGVLDGSKTSKEITIGFWVNVKNATGDYFHAPLFSAYAAAPATTGNGSPMFICQSRGILQINNQPKGGVNDWCDFAAAQNDKVIAGTATANTESTVWLDDKAWHYYTVTMTETKAIVYVDGAVVNSWTVDNSTNGQIISGLFTNPEGVPYICLGGNQAWDWSDNDAAYGFDDFAVYSSALSADQIKKIMNDKLAYAINAVSGETWLKTLDSGTANSGTTKTVSYPNYIHKDGKFYLKTAKSSPYWQDTFTINSAVTTVEYTEASTANVLYYSEAEDISNVTKGTSASNLCSNGALGYTYAADGTEAYQNIVYLPAGTYQIHVRGVNSNNDGTTYTCKFKVGEQSFSQGFAYGNKNYDLTEFTLTDGAQLSFACDGTNKSGCDWIYITGTPTNNVVGAMDGTTDYLVANAGNKTLYKGDAYHFKFVNHNNSSNNWQNWVLPVYDSSWNKIAVVRADNWEDVGGSNTGCTSNFEWTNFPASMNGATVDMKVSYSTEGTFKMESTIATSDSKNWTYSYTKEGLSYDNVITTPSVSHSWLEVTEQWGLNTVTCSTAEKGTVTASVDGGTTTAASLSDVKDGTTVTLVATANEGYVFKSYTVTDASGKTVTVTDNTFTMPANSVTVAAEFTDISTSTVTLSAEDATTAGTASVTATYGSAMPDATMPTRTDYTFTGYFDSDNKQYYDKDGNSVNNWDKSDATATLFAHWTQTKIYTGGTVGSTCAADNLWWTAFSPYTTIKKGETYNFSFVNHTLAEGVWQNWLLVCSTDADRNDTDNGYKEYFVVRPDHLGNRLWGDGTNTVTVDGAKEFTDADFMSRMEGATVNMTVKYDGSKVTATAVTTAADEAKTSWTMTLESTGMSGETLRLFHTVEKAYLTNYSAVANSELASISSATTWDWSKAASTSVAMPTESNWYVLSNLTGINNDDNFYGQALAAKGGANSSGEAIYYAYRSTTIPAFVGKDIKFNTTVPGKVVINASNPNTNKAVTFTYNSTTIQELAASAAQQDLTAFNVTAGDVSIHMDNAPRIFKITFTPESYTAATDISLLAKSGNDYYATFSDASNVTFWPNDVTVSKVSVAGTTMTTTALETATVTIEGSEKTGYFVPANTGVLIKKTTTDATVTAFYYKVGGKAVSVLTDNMLCPATGATTVAPGEGNYYFYKLAYNDYTAKTGLGFYWGAANGATFTAKAGGAYLAVQQSQAAKLSGFAFDGDDSATAIEAVDANTNAIQSNSKFFKNGQLVIVKNGKQYNAAGQQVK